MYFLKALWVATFQISLFCQISLDFCFLLVDIFLFLENFLKDISWKSIFIRKRCDTFVLSFLNNNFWILSFLLKSDWVLKVSSQSHFQILRIFTIFFLTLFCTTYTFSNNFGTLNFLLKKAVQIILESFTSFSNLFPHNFLSNKFLNISFLPNKFNFVVSFEYVFSDSSLLWHFV